MKHRIAALLLAILMTISLFPGVSAGAPEVVWDYEQTADGIRLLKYNGTEKDLTIPTDLAGQMVVAIGDGCFRGSTTLETVEIPYGIRAIGNEAFYRCTALTKATVGGTVNIIGDRAFAYTDIASMHVPGSVHTIGSEAFRGCEGLLNIAFEGGVEDAGDLFPNSDGEGTGSVKMSEGVRTLGSRVFFDCVNLTRMQIPASVTAIGNQAIGYKTGDGGAVKQNGYLIYGYAGTTGEQYARDNGIAFEIMGVIDPKSGSCGAYATWSFDGGVLTISGTGRMYDYGAAEYQPWYPYRSQIQTVIVEEGITALGAFALADTAVSALTLPRSLTQVRQKAISNCRSLTEITFPGDAPAFFKDAFTGTTLLAWYPDGNSTWTAETMQNYGGQITWRMAGSLPFVDVPADIYFHAPVAWATESGITNGTSDTTFEPTKNCNRAQVVTFLWRAAGKPEPTSSKNSFTDVNLNEYYGKAVLWAVEKGITTGTSDTTFKPTKECNRAQVVTFLWRAKGSTEPTSTTNPFNDVNEGDYFYKAVLWAAENGITTGKTANTFVPTEICNRAQVVTFLYRAYAA